jgi:hypothetical protein
VTIALRARTPRTVGPRRWLPPCQTPGQRKVIAVADVIGSVVLSDAGNGGSTRRDIRAISGRRR